LVAQDKRTGYQIKPISAFIIQAALALIFDYRLIEVLSLLGRRHAYRRDQELPAAFVNRYGLCTPAELLIAHHEMLVEFFGKAVDLKPFLKHFSGLFPLQIQLPVRAQFQDKTEEFAAQALPEGKDTGMSRISRQKVPFIKSEGLLAQLHCLRGEISGWLSVLPDDVDFFYQVLKLPDIYPAQTLIQGEAPLLKLNDLVVIDQSAQTLHGHFKGLMRHNTVRVGP
jgi:hypothetical protein